MPRIWWWRCRGNSTAVDHIPREYHVIENANFTSSTRKLCLAADKHNEAVHKRRMQLVASRTGVKPVAGGIAPPEPSNVTRYDAWRELHRPVPADLQAAAVQKLLELRSSFDRAAPHLAPSAARLGDRADPLALPPPPGEDAYLEAAAAGYQCFAWSELPRKTVAECEAADAANTRAHSRRARRSVKVESVVCAEPWATMHQVELRPPPSNALRKAAHLRRGTLVPALPFSEAVERLWRAGLRAGVHYEPQQALSTPVSPYGPVPTAPAAPLPPVRNPPAPDVAVEIPAIYPDLGV
jgi:hypothetical protein